MMARSAHIKAWGSRGAIALFALVANVVSDAAEVCDKVDENWQPGESPFHVFTKVPFAAFVLTVLLLLILCGRFKLLRTSRTLAICFAALALFGLVFGLILDDNYIRSAAYREGCRSFASDVVSPALFCLFSLAFYWISARGSMQTGLT
jgi:glucan phosphoethanolaminetransferase (alkaline phosphatase superfamily)